MHDSEKDLENAKLELASLYLLIKIQKKENVKIYDYIKYNINYQNLSEGIEYEKLLQKEEEQIRNISRTELILKNQCEKYAKKIDELEKNIEQLKINLVRIFIL